MGASYRRLGVESLEALRGAGVFYGAAASEAPTVSDEEVYVVGGANSAGQAVLHLAHFARRVTLVVRAATLEAGMSHYLIRQIEATPNIEVRTSTEVVGGGGVTWLEHLTLRERGGGEEKVSAHALFLMIGAKPYSDWCPRLSSVIRGVRHDRSGSEAGRGSETGSSPAAARDQPPRRLGSRRHPTRLGEASGLGRG